MVGYRGQAAEKIDCIFVSAALHVAKSASSSDVAGPSNDSEIMLLSRGGQLTLSVPHFFPIVAK